METESIEKKSKTIDKKPKTIVSQLESIEKVLKELVAGDRKVLNSTEAAIYLKYTRKHIYRLVKNDNLPCHRPKGRRLFFIKADLEYWLIKRLSPYSNKPAMKQSTPGKNG